MFRKKSVAHYPEHNTIVEQIAIASVTVILIYMGTDTIRKILIHTAATKIN